MIVCRTAFKLRFSFPSTSRRNGNLPIISGNNSTINMWFESLFFGFSFSSYGARERKSQLVNQHLHMWSWDVSSKGTPIRENVFLSFEIRGLFSYLLSWHYLHVNFGNRLEAKALDTWCRIYAKRESVIINVLCRCCRNVRCFENRSKSKL